jgi:uncharacterized membrane protein YhfC
MSTAGPIPLNVPFLLVALFVQYPLMLALPLLAGWWIHRRYRQSWRIFGIGALTFILSQVLHIPFNTLTGLGRGLPLPVTALLLGLSAGVFEEGTRWLVLRFVLRRARGWHAALQFGAGHEAAESIILGFLALLTLVNMLVLRTANLAAMGLSGAMAEQTRAAVVAYWGSAWYMPVLSGFERAATLVAQIALAVLVMRSLTHHQPLYLLAAIAAHATLDFSAVWVSSTFGVLASEAALLVLAALCLALVIWLREPGPEAVSVEDHSVLAVSSPPSAASLAPRTLTAEELARRADASRYE